MLDVPLFRQARQGLCHDVALQHSFRQSFGFDSAACRSGAMAHGGNVAFQIQKLLRCESNRFMSKCDVREFMRAHVVLHEGHESLGGDYDFDRTRFGCIRCWHKNNARTKKSFWQRELDKLNFLEQEGFKTPRPIFDAKVWSIRHER